MTDEIEKDREYGSGTATEHGYMVEWRLKPESRALADVLNYGNVEEIWRQAQYKISQLGRSQDAANVIQPAVNEWSKERSNHGLVGHKVAVMACLQTSTDRKLLKHVEWRIVRIELKTTHKLTRSDDDKDHENRMNEIKAMFGEYAAQESTP